MTDKILLNCQAQDPPSPASSAAAADATADAANADVATWKGTRVSGAAEGGSERKTAEVMAMAMKVITGYFFGIIHLL